MDRSKYHVGVIGMTLAFAAYVLIPLSNVGCRIRDRVLKARGLEKVNEGRVRLGVIDVVVIYVLIATLAPLRLIGWLGSKAQAAFLGRNPGLVEDWEAYYGTPSSPRRRESHQREGGNDGRDAR